MVESRGKDSNESTIQPIFVGNISAQQSVKPIFDGYMSSQQSNIQLKYSPKPNYRYWSYGVIAILFPISMYLIMGPYYAQTDMIGFSICCALPSVVCFLDAIYSHGKSEWEITNGIPNNKSRSGMVLNIVLGSISLGIFLFGLFTMFSF